MTFALLFPGQGSQEVGMLGALAAFEPLVAPTFAEASEVLGWDLAGLVANGPAAELNRTQRTQPALLAASVALYRAFAAKGWPAPLAMAGHSLGEYSALVCAGALAFGDALKLVELRGELMQAAVPEGSGAMAAVIGLDDGGVDRLCAAYSGEGVLEPANFNAPGQVVVAGTRGAVDWLVANGKLHGARKVMPIPVSVPSHCSLMRGAAEQLAAALQTVAIRAPQVPVLHNLDAAARSDADGIRAALIAQLYRPVRWSQSVQALAARGVSGYLECGPGKVLANMIKRIVETGEAIALSEADGFARAKAFLQPQTDQA